MLREMPSKTEVSSGDDAPLIVKRLPRNVEPTDSDASPKMRNPRPTAAANANSDEETSEDLPAPRSESSGIPKKLPANDTRNTKQLPAASSTRSDMMKHPLLQLQAREEKDGRSVNGSPNSSDDAGESDISCVSQGNHHSDGELHRYLASLGTQPSQTDFPTPLHKQKLSDDIWNGRELLADRMLDQLEAKRLARAQLKAADPTAYAARRAELAAQRAAREAARLAKKHAAKNPAPANNASKLVQQMPQAPCPDSFSSNRGRSPKVASPKIVSDVITVSSDSEPQIDLQMPSLAAVADDVRQPKLHPIFKPFCRAVASNFTLSHEDQFHALVKRDHSLKSPPKLVENVQPPPPPVAVAGSNDVALGLSFLIAPSVLFPTAAGVSLMSPCPTPSHLSPNMLSPIGRPRSLPLVRSHQSPPVHQTQSATFSDKLLAKKKPDMRPSPKSHACDPVIAAENKLLHNRLKLRRKQPLFCSGSELCEKVADAGVQTSPRGLLEKASTAALLNVAVQTSPRGTIEPHLNAAVQTSPRCALELCLDAAIQTSPRTDPEKPVTAREMRSAIHEMLVGLGFFLE